LKECGMTRERERDSHVEMVAGRELWERLLALLDSQKGI
jgi:hypothetical protein